MSQGKCISGRGNYMSEKLAQGASRKIFQGRVSTEKPFLFWSANFKSETFWIGLYLTKYVKRYSIKLRFACYLD